MCNMDAEFFDIGVVPIGWEPEGFCDREIDVDRRRKPFSEVDLYEMNRRIDLGADFAGTLYGNADQHPEDIAAATADEARP